MGYLLVIDDDEKLCDLIARCLGAPGRPVLSLLSCFLPQGSACLKQRPRCRCWGWRSC